jgi:hypothetical protein
MQITEYQVMRQFYSRRNEVFLINARQKDGSHSDFVYKSYLTGDIERECHHLRQLQGMSIPKILAKGTNALSLEYIHGHLLLEKLEETENASEPFLPYLIALIDFFEHFYDALPGHVYGDINLRNFILAEDGLYGIDLEETRRGKIAVDIGKTAAYLLTYDPANTPYKKEIADFFIGHSAERFSISKQDIIDNMTMELDYMKIRRHLRDDRKHHIAQMQ